ncbi:fibroblast growth factor receptor-like 1 [Limulus polyphemus]|uniref:Fibroblast growth factor receptor-like 1 n=1 Tax=Limulus polyphemus TaxID=6850 RepID=A0ABM1TR39_LIMPO|nr:fibroblast growth factor receptor-like 1 [Limulus polyphemus]
MWTVLLLSVLFIFPGCLTQDRSHSISGSPPKTVVSQKDQFIEVQEGETVHLECNAKADSGKLFYEWYKDGEILETYFRNRFDITEETGILQIRSTKCSDSGVYTCEAVNGFGSVKFSINLRVTADPSHQKPQIQTPHSQNITVNEGNPVVLQCKVSSTTEPVIKWLKQISAKEKTRRKLLKVPGFKYKKEYYIVLQGSSGVPEIDGHYANKLEIASTRKSDAGKYICLAANYQGFRSTEVILQVVNPANTSHDQELGEVQGKTNITYSPSKGVPATKVTSTTGFQFAITIITSVCVVAVVLATLLGVMLRESKSSRNNCGHKGSPTEVPLTAANEKAPNLELSKVHCHQHHHHEHHYHYLP